MKRRNWLIAVFVAAFVLQTPLCALACVPSTDAMAVTDAAHHDTPPCHESAPNTNPAQAPDAQNDCGCDDSPAAVLANGDPTSVPLSSVVAIPPVDPATRRPDDLVLALRGHPNETDLPPPDILLLKSTLLI